MACLLAAGLMLSACVAPEEGATTATSRPLTALTPPTQSSEQATETQPRPVSGTLRLDLPGPNSFDPLRVTSSAYRQLLPLLYSSLFRIGPDGTLEAQLVASYDWQGDRRRLSLRLRDDYGWSDEGQIGAGDVIATLEAIRRTPDSPWYAGVSRIRRATALDDQQLELDFAQADPFALYGLTFPVLRGDWLRGERRTFAPSSGPYRAARVEGNEAIGLSQNVGYPEQAQLLIPEIELRFTSSFESSVSRMLDDHIDLLPMQPQHYLTYHRSGHLSMQRFASRRFYYLHYGLSEGGAFDAESGLFEQVKALLTDISNAAAVPAGLTLEHWLPRELIEPFALPIVPTFASGWPAATRLFTEHPLTFDPDYQYPEGRSALRLIHAHEPFSQMLASRIIERLAAYGIRAEASDLGAEDYDEAIAEGDYDLCLAYNSLGDIPDPLWLYSPTSGHGPETGQSWSAKSPLGWSRALAALRSYRLPEGIDDPFQDPNWATLVSNCERLGPFTSLGCLYEGMIYGERVQGPRPRNAFNPLGRIEEMWIWSGPSS